jgi:hypothetical protein
MALDTTEIGLIGSGGGLVVLFGISVFIMWYNNQNHSDKILSNSKILEANKAPSASSTSSHNPMGTNDFKSVIDNAFGRNATKRRKKQRKNKSNKRNKRN